MNVGLLQRLFSSLQSVNNTFITSPSEEFFLVLHVHSFFYISCCFFFLFLGNFSNTRTHAFLGVSFDCFFLFFFVSFFKYVIFLFLFFAFHHCILFSWDHTELSSDKLEIWTVDKTKKTTKVDRYFYRITVSG